MKTYNTSPKIHQPKKPIRQLHDPLPTVTQFAMDTLLKDLSTHGLQKEGLTIKIKDLKQKDWLALYRSRSQFRPAGAIVWLNKYIYRIADKIEREYGGRKANEYKVVTDSIRHEYGHIIAEWALLQNPELHQKIVANWSDEEEFAENFAQWLAGDLMTQAEEDNYTEVFNQFKKDIEARYTS